MSSIVNRLTEGIVNRDMRAEGNALLSKWERTGLLEGMDSERSKHGMARLLENQAKELLRESSAMASGDVEGFAAVAFPIVRRVFAGLIANDLVSVQPMSLPSGLIFFLDFTTSTDGAGLPRMGYHSAERSLYGGGVVGSELTGGVKLTGSFAERGPYALNNGYASPTGSDSVAPSEGDDGWVLIASGVVGGSGYDSQTNQDKLDKMVQYDPDLSGTVCAVWETTGSSIGNREQLNIQNLVAMTVDSIADTAGLNAATIVRRHTRVSSGSTTQDPSKAGYKFTLVFTQASGSVPAHEVPATGNGLMGAITGSGAVQLSYPINDNFTTSTAIGSLIGATEWGLEGHPLWIHDIWRKYKTRPDMSWKRNLFIIACRCRVGFQGIDRHRS